MTYTATSISCSHTSWIWGEKKWILLRAMVHAAIDNARARLHRVPIFRKRASNPSLLMRVRDADGMFCEAMTAGVQCRITGSETMQWYLLFYLRFSWGASRTCDIAMYNRYTWLRIRVFVTLSILGNAHALQYKPRNSDCASLSA